MSKHSLDILEYRIPQRLRIADCLNSLQHSFPFQAEPLKQYERIYYDSADWQLYNKGYVLVAESDPSALLVQLCRTSNLSGQRSLMLDHMPNRADAFPSHFWQQRLSAMLDRRVLTPQLTLHCRVIRLRYVDAKGKTCLRLAIEHNGLVDNKNRHVRFLGKRIRLLPVQGFGAFAQKVRTHIQCQLGLDALNETELQAGLALLQRQPGQTQNTIDVVLRAEMSAASAMREIFLQLLENIEMNEQGILHNAEPESLHDFRVAIRRTRTGLSEIKGVFDKRRVQRFRNDFAWLGQVTGQVRDLQVYLEKHSEYCKSLPQKKRAHLTPIKKMLEKNLVHEIETLQRQLQSQHYRNLKQGWYDFLTRQNQDSPDQDSPDVLNKGLMPVKPLASECIWKKYQDVLGDGNVISLGAPSDKLHRLRIDGKKLRYLMEFFSSLYPPEGLQHLIKTLKKLQDNLGDFHDLQVQMNALRQFLEQLAQKDLLTSETQAAVEYLISHMNDMQLSQRLLFKECFAQFSSKQHQTQFAVLFGPREGEAD